ncbi:hypothetical protein LX36DRAFT_651440, partial [Colletotrichum falcatum]
MAALLHLHLRLYTPSRFPGRCASPGSSFPRGRCSKSLRCASAPASCRLRGFDGPDSPALCCTPADPSKPHSAASGPAWPPFRVSRL